MDGALSYEEVLSLYASADVFVALHRSEGLGLGLMEAMCLGKPVIATAWSGNMSYMDETNSCLVRYSLVNVEPTVDVYRHAIRGKHALWADPDIDHAAAWMKTLADEPERRRAIGGKAAADMVCYQRQAEDECFIEDLRRLAENRAQSAHDKEEDGGAWKNSAGRTPTPPCPGASGFHASWEISFTATCWRDSEHR